MGGADPYAVASLTSGKEFRTATCKATTAPVWEECWETEVRMGKDMNVTIRVWDDNLGMDREVGRLPIPIPQGITKVGLCFAT